MIIEIRKNESDPSYLVRIGDDVFEMGIHANLPNGLCMYSGPAITGKMPGWVDAPVSFVKEVPVGILLQIVNIIEKDRESDIAESAKDNIPCVSLSKEDLEDCGFDISNVTDEQMKQIAKELSSYYNITYSELLSEFARNAGIVKI